LAFNDARSSVSLLVLAEKDAPTPIHKHLGAAEIYMLKGSLSYEEGTAREGDYLFEAGGTVHIAEARDEVLSLVIFHGPLMGYNDDGSVAGVCDVDLFYKLAADNNAVAHLPPR
jgi:quercetin dioxygenase-like cupin family protein